MKLKEIKNHIRKKTFYAGYWVIIAIIGVIVAGIVALMWILNKTE